MIKKIDDKQKEKFEEEFNFLEDLRKSGKTNMYGATPYLIIEFAIGKEEASEILMEFMHRYEELSAKSGWGI